MLGKQPGYCFGFFSKCTRSNRIASFVFHKVASAAATKRATFSQTRKGGNASAAVPWQTRSMQRIYPLIGESAIVILKLRNKPNRGWLNRYAIASSRQGWEAKLLRPRFQ